MQREDVRTKYPATKPGAVPDAWYGVSDEDVRTKYPAAPPGQPPKGWEVKEWTVGFEETPLYEKYETHVDEGMEFIVLVSDRLARRGTGKTTLSIQLADRFDRTDDGLLPSKATNSPEEFIDAYVEHPKGSGLLFDEAEAGVNARDAMTRVNKTMNEKISVGRVGEKYAVWNMPDVGQIDKEVQKLAHVWILVTRKGRARAYELSYNPFEGRNYPTPLCDLQWDPLTEEDDHLKDVFDALHEVKWETLRDEDDDFVPMSEHREIVDRTEEEAEREKRDEMIHALYDNDLLPVKEIADIVELSYERTRQIAKGEE